MNLNKYIDHTLLKQDALTKDIDKVIEEAITYDFASVCVNPVWVKYVSKKLKKSDVKTCCVVGFPLGANKTSVKVYETKAAVIDGATEIDMVINISKLKEQDYNYVLKEINKIKKATKGRTLKVIVETSLLTEEEKTKAAEIVLQSNADFIKTSTGLSTGGATIEDIKLFNEILGTQKGIKASGGVRTKQFALDLIEAGATRLGTSGGVAIVNNQENTQNY